MAVVSQFEIAGRRSEPTSADPLSVCGEILRSPQAAPAPRVACSYSRSDCPGNKTQRLKIPSAVPNGMLSNARNERTMGSMRAQGSCRSSPHPAKNSTAAFTKIATPIMVKSELRKPPGICGGGLGHKPDDLCLGHLRWFHDRQNLTPVDSGMGQSSVVRSYAAWLLSRRSKCSWHDRQRCSAVT